MVRTNQGGSVLSFVAIGVLVVVLFVGGVYVVHRQVTQPNPEVVPAQKPTSSEPEKQSSKTPEKQDKKTPQSPSRQSNTPPVSNSNGTNELPQTGPTTELLASLFALGLLSAMAVSYVRSRRLDLSL
jgi:LPXTG-motif cell wall-anchored protein